MPDWVAQGWISEEAAVRLAARYPLPPRRAAGPVVLSLLGSVLVLGGIILILAHNWEELSRPLRAALALLPLLVTGWLGLRQLSRPEGPSLAARESVALGNSLAAAAAISLIAQTYQISGDWPRFLLTWSLLTLPGAFLLRSAASLALFATLALAWILARNSDATALLGALPLITAIGIWLWLECGKAGRCLAVLGVYLLLCGLVLAPAVVGNPLGWQWSLPAYLCWFGGVYALSAPEPLRPASAATRVLSLIGMGGVALALSFGDAWSHRGIWRWSHRETEHLALGYTWLLGFAAFAAAATVLCWRSADTVRRSWMLFPLVISVLWILRPYGPTADLGFILVNITLGALGLLTFLDGWRNSDGFRLNFGWLALCALILVRFFDSDLGFLTRGIAFVAAGLSFIALNRFLSKRRATEGAAP